MFKIQLFSQNSNYNNTSLNFLGKGQVLKQTARTIATKLDSFQNSSSEICKHKDTINKMVTSITKMVKNNKTTEEITEWIINKSGVVALSILALSGIRPSRIYEPYMEIIATKIGEGKTDSEIAEEIGKDAMFVFNVRKCFNIKRAYHKGQIYEPYRITITAMTQEGMSYKEIANVIGKDITFVTGAKRYFGLIHPKQHTKRSDAFEQNRETITRMAYEYKTNKEIACAINETEAFVVSAKTYFGLTHLHKKGDVYQPYKEQISQMCRDGMSDKEIADKIGKNTYFVGNAKNCFGITTSEKKGKVYKPYENKIKQMVKEGRSNEEIADAINKDAAFVNNAKMHFGLTRPKPKKGDAYEPYREIITQMDSEGKSYKEIADKIGKNTKFVSNAKVYFKSTEK